MNSTVNCFTLQYGARFLPSLASYVLEKYDTSNYNKILILLPNRRSCRALRDAFLECSGGKPLLLPKIQPIGEIEEEVFFSVLGNANIPDIHPINKARRHFLLMRLIMEFQHGNAKQSSELVSQLVKFMDEVSIHGLSYSKLASLVPENLAEHWQKTLDFLTIVSRQWPRVLKEESVVDAVEYRNKMLEVIGELWKKTPPDYPVIAAGSTGSQPATAELLNVISRLPQGMVILPALDKGMDAREWNMISYTHPQYVLKQLLEKIGIARDEVKWLGKCDKNDREKYARIIFSPPAATPLWPVVHLPPKEALEGIKIIEADSLLDEARLIAIAMREALETPAKTAALITPDRTLARMVSAQLKRFGIIVDDSAGKPLATSAPACFLRLVAEMVSTNAAPSALLAVLRHPLAGAGMDTAKCRWLSREMEILLLRGIRRESGLVGLLQAAVDNKYASGELVSFLKALTEKSIEFSQLFLPFKNAAFKDLLEQHIGFAQWLASTDSESGEQRLWAGEAGNALAELIAEWNLQADVLPVIDAFTYPALFDALLNNESYNTQVGLHPRLHILGPIEARLQSYDLVIMGSLNEGVWPKKPQADPWMSRPQREAFGLPSASIVIGQGAHDFVMQLSAPKVLLTRARKVEGVPSIPSRWLVRIKTLLGARVPEEFSQMNDNLYYELAKNLLEKPAECPSISAPSPAPPFAARPRKLRVTAIDTWLRDPYSLYVRYILGLRKLDEIDREPDAADFGNIVHKALENFTQLYPKNLPDDAYDKLLSCGQSAFVGYIDRPAVATLWWPRFVAMAGWFLGQEQIRRKYTESVYSEVKANWDFEVDGRNFSLSTRIDRLEKLRSGGYALIDYKTGAVPSKRDRENGISNQLPLEALIIQKGNLPALIENSSVLQMEYWKLSGSEVKCEVSVVEAGLEETHKMLYELIRKFDDEKIPYNAQTEGSSKFSDYDHLTRKKEWETV